jgi:asparagine synthetase B (glutamine-hydrolysing)
LPPRLLGHARLATFGAVHDDPGGLQPIAAGGHWLAHNGNVYNAAALHPGARTDSGALAALYATLRAAGAGPGEALEVTVGKADQVAWAIVVLDSTGALVAHRHGLPLWRHVDPTGVYLSSRPFLAAVELPAGRVCMEAVA